MSEKELREQLKLSKMQNKKTRYNYIAKSFNSIDYAINLEKYIINILKENQKLKEQVEYLRRSIERKEETIIDLRNDNTLCSKEYVSKLEKEKQELIDFIKKEQDRLSRECSQIYEDSLGKTRLVNEEIYNEVSLILSKIEKRQP